MGHSRALRLAATAAALLVVFASASSAEVQVTAAGPLISVKATRASVGDVLQQIGRATGMKVQFDGAPPHASVTVDLVSRPVSEAVERVLEGAGINFAWTLQGSQGQVASLLLLGAPTPRPGGGFRPDGAAPPVVNRLLRPEPPADVEPTVDDDVSDGNPGELFQTVPPPDPAPPAQPAAAPSPTPPPPLQPYGILGPAIPAPTPTPTPQPDKQ
jgi:hypothetical protein